MFHFLEKLNHSFWVESSPQIIHENTVAASFSFELSASAFYAIDSHCFSLFRLESPCLAPLLWGLRTMLSICVFPSATSVFFFLV